jgi:hypothetical protein
MEGGRGRGKGAGEGEGEWERVGLEGKGMEGGGELGRSHRNRRLILESKRICWRRERGIDSKANHLQVHHHLYHQQRTSNTTALALFWHAQSLEAGLGWRQPSLPRTGSSSWYLKTHKVNPEGGRGRESRCFEGTTSMCKHIHAHATVMIDGSRVQGGEG